MSSKKGRERKTLQKENGEQVYAQFENNEKGFAQLGQWLSEPWVSQTSGVLVSKTLSLKL